MTPEELYQKYKGRKAREFKDCAVAENDLCEGIIVGYTNNVSDDFNLIIVVTNGSNYGWMSINDDDIIVDDTDHPDGYQYVRVREILFKFGRK